jgi:G:T-mismatch repair DNA endonuclease (very short patch repair protein)
MEDIMSEAERIKEIAALRDKNTKLEIYIQRLEKEREKLLSDRSKLVEFIREELEKDIDLSL